MNRPEQIKSFVEFKIKRILSMTSDSAARASLANLRRGVGHTPGEIPTIWGEFLLDMPEELIGKGAEISRAEWAIYTALTLFALHQQGKDRKSEPMSREGISLGTAARKLIKSENDDRERVARRFYPAATAADIAEMSHHLRSLVTLLRSEGIPLDYGMLASDLYAFQNPDTADRVKLRWGEDFCRFYNKDNEEQTTNEEEN